MPVLLTPPSHSDIHDLLAFELTNRQFFEGHINARPANYYSDDGVAQAIEAALQDATHDRGYQYLLKTIAGEIVGRVNLSNVKRQHFHSAVLGYRIAESACGQGLASEAVRLISTIAFRDLGLARIEADSRKENSASVRVLVRNGFVQFGHSRRSFELGGAWYDRLHFERHADDFRQPG
jgi:ribosomal-protein-alanine N-acetyltransferase